MSRLTKPSEEEGIQETDMAEYAHSPNPLVKQSLQHEDDEGSKRDTSKSEGIDLTCGTRRGKGISLMNARARSRSRSRAQVRHQGIHVPTRLPTEESRRRGDRESGYQACGHRQSQRRTIWWYIHEPAAKAVEWSFKNINVHYRQHQHLFTIFYYCRYLASCVVRSSVISRPP